MMNLRDYFRRIKCAVKQAQEAWRNTSLPSREGDWIDNEMAGEDVRGASILQHYQPAGQVARGRPDLEFDPEEYTKEAERFDSDTSISPSWFMRQVQEGKARVASAYVFEARVNRQLKMLKEGNKPYRIVPVHGHDAFMKKFGGHELAMRKMIESNRGRYNIREDFSDGPYDPNQYTEYAPIMGGYFYAQMYLHDMLKQQAYAFEAWNHNPLAHRIINALSQYSMGRRFDWHMSKKAKDADKKEKVWEEYAKRINLRQRLSKYWAREKHIFGDLMLNLATSHSIHPATVWEIVTEPTDITNIYYYYRSYPTQWQMFTGFNVKGAPGSKDVKAQDYVIEQIPYKQVLHLKSNCTSFEKRGRSTLFPVLGWLKRVKDLYNSQVTREQMLADYAWDVTVKGGPGDVNAFMSAYANVPKGSGNQFVHNEAVTRQVISAASGSTGRGGGGATSDNILAFVATAIGFPKDFFNIISAGGGNRATALVAAEPFTKVIEDDQADFEFLLHQLAEKEFERNGLKYEKGDIEFVFPSVTKDTTTETVKNIQLGLSEGWLSRETAGEMYAQEMNITTYDYEDQQQQLKDEQSRGDLLGPVPPPPGRMGGEGPDGVVSDDESPIHGSGKVDLKDQLDTL